MAKRFLAAAIGVPMILAVVFFGVYAPVLFDISVAIICAISVGEFSHATNTLKLYQISIPSLLFAAAYPFLLTLGYSDIAVYVYSGIVLSMMIFFHKKITYKELAYIFCMTMIITCSLSTIVSLPWMADIGAFFAGSFLGKHKLCPEISPKKTVEGAVGGVIFCVAATCFIGWLFTTLLYGGSVRVEYISLGCLAFIGSLLSILGDLSFSLVKRNFGIKDYGTILPGHGGFLDRFDSVVFVSPLMLVFISYFPIISF